jgi:hypothetical protein
MPSMPEMWLRMSIEAGYATSNITSFKAGGSWE